MSKSAPIAAAAFLASVAVTACGVAGAVLLAFTCLILTAPIVFMIGSMHDVFNGPGREGGPEVAGASPSSRPSSGAPARARMATAPTRATPSNAPRRSWRYS